MRVYDGNAMAGLDIALDHKLQRIGFAGPGCSYYVGIPASQVIRYTDGLFGIGIFTVTKQHSLFKTFIGRQRFKRF